MNRVLGVGQQLSSNCNVRAWEVFVASGAFKDRVRWPMVGAACGGGIPETEYPERGDFSVGYRTRQDECTVALYSKMGVGRGDKEGRMRAVLRNFEFFDAPHIAFLGMHADFGPTVAIDVGMFAQSLMLSMVAFGLHSCPMGTMRNYPDMVREAFEIADGTKILFGISFGYEDTSVDANETQTTRDDISANMVFRSE